MTKRSYKFRVYPTEVQRQQMAIDFGHARFAYNLCLARMNESYSNRKESISIIDFSKELTFLKKLETYSWLKDATNAVMTQKLRDLDTAFKNFFAGRAKYPRFKKKAHEQRVRYPMDQRTIANTYRAGKLLKLPKVGVIKVKWSRVPAGIPKMVTLIKDSADRYFISFSCEENIQQLEHNQKAVGIDIGVKNVFVTSDGYASGNPKHLGKLSRKLKLEQRKLSRKTKGSNRWHKQRQRVAKLHSRISNGRADWIHKATTNLVREYGAIAIEDLNVSGMMRNRKLSKAIGDAGFRMFRTQLEYKSIWYGRELFVLDRWFPSSKTCSACGSVNESLTLKDREWVCECGEHHDRDVNAAINILNECTVGSTETNVRGAGNQPDAITA